MTISEEDYAAINHTIFSYGPDQPC